jgi:hypothetical protein
LPRCQTQVLAGLGVRRKIWPARDEDRAHDRENEQRHSGKKIPSRKTGRHNQIAKRGRSQGQHGTTGRTSSTREQRKRQRLERFHGRDLPPVRSCTHTEEEQQTGKAANLGKTKRQKSFTSRGLVPDRENELRKSDLWRRHRQPHERTKHARQ